LGPFSLEFFTTHHLDIESAVDRASCPTLADAQRINQVIMITMIPEKIVLVAEKGPTHPINICH
jgi:hypothetical protein